MMHTKIKYGNDYIDIEGSLTETLVVLDQLGIGDKLEEFSPSEQKEPNEDARAKHMKLLIEELYDGVVFSKLDEDGNNIESLHIDRKDIWENSPKFFEGCCFSEVKHKGFINELSN